ncbi:MAG TPA: hypothetical protein VF103_11360 [Polyangiaceae bacterium]
MQPFRPASALALIPFVLCIQGCQKKDPEKCAQAQATTKQALAIGDFALARQWREHAYKQCDDPGALSALDKEIVDTEAALTAKKEAEEQKKKETADLLKLFLDFVAQTRANPETASAAPVCDPPAPPPPGTKAAAESKDRFCTAARQVGSRYQFQVKYWDADHGAFRYTTTPGVAVDCQMLGATVQKKWEVAAEGGKAAKRWRCDLGGALSGLTAVVSGAVNAEVHVFTPSYLDHDPGWRPILEGP